PTLPAASVAPPDHVLIANTPGNLSGVSIAVDPVHPNRMVAVYTRTDTDPGRLVTPVDLHGPTDQGSVALHPYATRVEAQYSVDSGATWHLFQTDDPLQTNDPLVAGLPYNLVDPVKTVIIPNVGIDVWRFQQ